MYAQKRGDLVVNRGRGIGGYQLPNDGATNIWLTPPELVEALGPFDLDPCAAPDPRPWSTADRHITLPEDGLTAEWGGLVWLNPPYGTKTGRWLARLADYGSGIALIFARTETRMFFDYVWPKATSLLFLKGRVYFHHPDGTRGKWTGGAPSVLVAYGEDAHARLTKVSDRGCLVRLRSGVGGSSAD